MRTTIDDAGRVVIPKAIRESAGLQPGKTLDIAYREGKVEIELVRPRAQVRRVGNRLVLAAPRGTRPLTADQVRTAVEHSRNREARRT